MQHFDYVIVGAGIAGASAAYELARLGSVLVLEREPHAGYHTTGRSAALFTEALGNRTVRALTRASRSFLAEPPSGFAEQPLLTPRGCLYIARHDQTGRLREMAECEVASGFPFVPLTPQECLRRVPILRAGYVAGGLLEHDAMDIDVHGLHQGFLRGATARGAECVKNSEVVAIASGGRGAMVRTTNQEYEATIVINAAGAWADHVAELAGLAPIGLRPLRRTAMIIDLPDAPGTQWPFVADVDAQFYFKPEAGKLLASPVNETPSDPCDSQPDELEIAMCAERVERATNITIHRIGRRWAGLRTFAVDRAPVVGFDPAQASFFWLAGQGGFGIQTAPALSRLTSHLVRGLPCPEDLGELGFAVESVSAARKLPMGVPS